MNWMEGMVMQHYADQERKEKLHKIVNYVLSQPDDTTVNIAPICQKLGIKPTADEFNWILEQVQDA